MHITTTHPIVKSLSEYKPGQTLEQLVLSRFIPYIDLPIADICSKFQVCQRQSNQLYHTLTKAILGIPLAMKIEEFEKAAIQIRAVDLSYPANAKPGKRYLLWHIEEVHDEAYLRKVEFWTMPINDHRPTD